MKYFLEIHFISPLIRTWLYQVAKIFHLIFPARILNAFLIFALCNTRVGNPIKCRKYVRCWVQIINFLIAYFSVSSVTFPT